MALNSVALATAVFLVISVVAFPYAKAGNPRLQEQMPFSDWPSEEPEETICSATGLSCERWLARYDGPGDFDEPTSTVVSPDGGTVLVAGHSETPESANGSEPVFGFACPCSDVVVLAYDGGSGTLRWTLRFDERPGTMFWQPSIAIAPSGDRFYLTAGSTRQLEDGHHRSGHLVLAGETRTGNILWSTVFEEWGWDGTGDDDGYIALSPDGTTVYIGGTAAGRVNTTWSDGMLLAYNAEHGNLLWSSRYDTTTRFPGPPDRGHRDEAWEVVSNPDGGFVYLLMGSEFDNLSGLDAPVIAAYNSSTGNLAWDRSLHREGTVAVPGDLAASPDGRVVYVTAYGRRSGPETSNDLVAALDGQTGEVVWQVRPPEGNDSPHTWEAEDLAVDADGRWVYVAGKQRRDSGPIAEHASLAVHAFRADTGALTWSHAYDSPLEDSAFYMATGPLGERVYVAGTTLSPLFSAEGSSGPWAQGYQDVVTLSLDASTGDRVWTRFYSGEPVSVPLPKPDRGVLPWALWTTEYSAEAPRAIDVAPDGIQVFVAAISPAPTTWQDIATFAYETGADSGPPESDGDGPDARGASPEHTVGSGMVATPSGLALALPAVFALATFLRRRLP